MLFFPSVVLADDICSRFKYEPEINVKKVVDDDIDIKKSNESFVDKLGYAMLKPGYKYSLYTVLIPVNGGYCVSLRGIDIDVLYPSFDIVIDKSLTEENCAYKYVLEHEKDHVKNTRKVLDTNLENITENVLVKVVNSINPVFINSINEKNDVNTKIEEQLQNHPDIVALLKKIDNEIEEENKKIDSRGDQYEIYKCKDFYEQMKNSRKDIQID